MSPEPPGSETGTARVDLSITLAERRDASGAPGGIEGGILYSADLFDRSTAAALAGRLAGVLGQVAADPGLRVSQVQLLQPGRAAADRERAGMTPPQSCPALTLAWAGQRAGGPDPGRPRGDLRGRDLVLRGSWTRRRGGSPRHLTGLGAGPEQVVAVAMPRSAEMVAAVLGVAQDRRGVSAGRPGLPG